MSMSCLVTESIARAFLTQTWLRSAASNMRLMLEGWLLPSQNLNHVPDSVWISTIAMLLIMLLNSSSSSILHGSILLSKLTLRDSQDRLTKNIHASDILGLADAERAQVAQLRNGLG